MKVGDKTIKLTNVIYVPGFGANLISVSRLSDDGCRTVVKENGGGVQLVKGDVVLFAAPRVGRLYILTATHTIDKQQQNKIRTQTTQHKCEEEAHPTVSAATDTQELTPTLTHDLQLLHAKYGHISYSKLHDIFTNDSVIGLSELVKKMKNVKKAMVLMSKCECVGCLKGKMHRTPMTGTINHNANEVLSLLVADTMGPFRIPTLAGGRYILVVMDVHTRYLHVHILKHKDEAAQIIINLIKQAQTQTGKKAKVVHSDGGGEIVNKTLADFFTDNGTLHTTTTAGTPQHNALVERVNRTIMEMVRAMLYHSKAYLPLWGEAVNTAAYILRRSLTRAHSSLTPLQSYTGRKPDVSNLHVFGCDVYYHVLKEKRQGKLDERARKGIFVGYSKSNDLYYRIYDVEKRDVIVSRDVTFYDESFNEMKRLRESEEKNESVKVSGVSEGDALPDDMMDRLDELFPLLASDHPHTQNNDDEQQRRLKASHNNKQDKHEHERQDRDSASVSQQERSEREHDNEHVSSPHSNPSLTQVQASDARTSEDDTARVDSAVKEGRSNNESGTLRRSSRQKRTRFSIDPDDYAEAADSEECHTATQSATAIHKRTRTQTDDHESDVPLTYQQAVRGRDAKFWLPAIKKELNSHIKNRTWSVVKKLEGMNIVTTKWVFVKKRNEKGEVVRYKARWVARGFTQAYGIDYDETFSPVLKAKSLRLILALSASDDTETRQYDVTTAFLYADVHEDIYVTPPETMELGKDEVLKLNKALYGLKQSPREWNGEISAYLILLGFKKCVKDPCIYIKYSKTNGIMIIGLFVDDITASYKRRDAKEWNEIVKQLMSKYELTDVGTVKHLLGLSITHTTHNVTYISQQPYIMEKLREFDMSECKSTSTPGDPNIQLRDGAESADSHTYRSLVGSLVYASTWTRPDITHAVNMTSRFMSKPTATHMRSAKKVLRYLEGTLNYGLRYDNNGNGMQVSVEGYCDSDYAGTKGSDRKSTTGYCVYLNKNLVSWNSKKQQTVAQSTAEAELMAITEVMNDLLFFKHLLGEMGYKVQLAMIIYSDNQAAVKITHNDVNHDRTKHIEVRHFKVRDYIEDGTIDVKWLETTKQIADIFTKALNYPQFNTHRGRLVTQVPALR